MLRETSGWLHGGRMSFPVETRWGMLLRFEGTEYAGRILTTTSHAGHLPIE